MYRIAICDDESLFLDYLTKTTKEIMGKLRIEFTLTAFTEPQELLQTLKQEPQAFHLLLLDIIMDGINGINLARQIREWGNQVSILFITSSADFSLDGYSVYPIQYLLKPVSSEKLMEVISRDYQQHFSARNLLLPGKEGSVVIPVKQIRYIETLNRLVLVQTDNKPVPVCGTMRELSEHLPQEQFVRCHKSFFVNLHRVYTITRKEIQLDDGSVIPVGRAFYSAALEALISFLDR